MQSKKIFTISLAVMCMAAFAFIVADDSDAASLVTAKEPEWGGFNDVDNGHFYVYLKNTTAEEIKVTVVIYDQQGNEKDRTEATIPANAQEYEIKMSFGYGSSGDKYVRYDVLDADGNKIEGLSNGPFMIHVSHSIWKNTMTYVIVVIVILAIILIAFFVMRARSKKIAGTGKTFTQLEEERKAKKANKIAQKQTYSAGESKKKRQ